MANTLLIRGLPDTLSNRIESERRQNLMSQREFIISVLDKVQASKTTPTLFDEMQPRLVSPPTEQLPFSFCDMFAGIGGLRIGLENLGGRCQFSCEWDTREQKSKLVA